MLLGVKSDPVVLGQDTRAMAAPIQSFIAVGVPCRKHRRIPRLFKCRSGAGPGCFGWLWIVLHVLLSLKGRRGFIVATGLASRAWTAVSVHCPAAGHCHLCWEGVTVAAGCHLHILPLQVVTGQARGLDEAERDSGWNKDSWGV